MYTFVLPSAGVAVVDDELFGDGAESAFAPVPDVAGRFPPGRFGDQRRHDHGEPSATVLGGRRRRADAAFAPFAHVVDGGRGRRRTCQDACRRYDTVVDAAAAAATAASDGGRLRDGRQIGGGGGGGVAPAGAAAIAGTAQAEEIVRRDQKSGIRRVFHGAQIVQGLRGR